MIKFLSLLFFQIVFIAGSYCQTISLKSEISSPEVSYALGRLEKMLVESGYQVVTNSGSSDYRIKLEINASTQESEAYQITREEKEITIIGGDARGLIYGTLAVGENVTNDISLNALQPQSEKPHYPLRAIKHNTSWYSYRPSSALDQHYETLKNPKYWEAFLDMMVDNRFNSLSIWNLHPFVFMIESKNFPEASPFSAEEMEEWKVLHKAIFAMANERAIDTYIIPFNIFVSPEFAEAYNVASENVYPNYYVKGDTSEIVKRYMRESVTQILEEYPTLTGFGLTLGEGMAEMTPQERENWIYDTYIEGMRMAGRPVKLVHRIPFSSTTESLGATSVELEQLTRKAIEKEAKLDFIDGPIWADLKYNWSHAHSTPKLVKVHGGEMFDTFYNPLPEGYKITYTARNEDFFALRWGVPDFVREHIAQNSQTYVGGYFIGSESYIPAKDYFSALNGEVNWNFAFERQWLFYKIWGRLLYNPNTNDEVFSSNYTKRFGEDGKQLLEAMSLASSTQLRIGSLFDSRWDFTLYGEGLMALIGDDFKYISADDLINQPTMDPNYISVKDFIEGFKDNVEFDTELITPEDLVSTLESDCNKALELVDKIDTQNNLALHYEVSDIKIWANLGLHLADKLNGCIALQSFREGMGTSYQEKAIASFEKALSYWDQIIDISRPIYRDMPLTHYNAGSHDRNDNNLFHWALIRDQVAADVDIAKSATTN